MKRSRAQQFNETDMDVVDIRSRRRRTETSGRQPQVAPLPPEVWLTIFHMVVLQEGPVPFLGRAARVCQMWNKLVSEPSLWVKTDLSTAQLGFAHDGLLSFMATYRLSKCREISLSGWNHMTDRGVEELARRCPGLQSVNLSHCSSITAGAVSALLTNCPTLQCLNLSCTNRDAVSVKSMSQLGASLRDLNISGTHQTAVEKILELVMTSCPNLVTLDFSKYSFGFKHLNLDIDRFQQACPSLQVLRLNNWVLRASKNTTFQVQGVGFRNLRELSCNMVNCDMDNRRPSIDDNLLIRLLHNAHKLELLDLRCCGSINFKECFSLGQGQMPNCPIQNLEKLFLSQSSISDHSSCLPTLLLMWNHSLRELDLSWTNPASKDMERGIVNLTINPTCPLTDLNLAGSTATVTCVRLAVWKLNQLEVLDLTACRSLPRGIKRCHQGAAALRDLRQRLQDLGSSDSDTDSYEYEG